VISTRRLITDRLAKAMATIGAEGDPLVTPATDERFGDYQCNSAMGLAKTLKRKPRDIATDLVAALDVSDICDPPEIAGPGFINLRLSRDYLERTLGAVPPAGGGAPGAPRDAAAMAAARDDASDASAIDRLGIPPLAETETVVVDLSSPNLAKEMHVGHLRSTVIGHAVARILEFQGHTVIRENHVGDWGTQFGMLVAYLRRTHPEVLDRPDDLVITDLESFYVEAKKRFDADAAFKKESQETVVELQRGDEATRRIWRAFCDESLRHCHAIYDRLGVDLTDRGESFYNELMPRIVERLEREGHAVESDGALCIFLEGFTTRDGEPLPLIVRKRDGGYNYATSDLATIVHRIEELRATRIVYVVGLPQKLHFEQLFAAVRKAGWAGDDVHLEHLGFGSMLAPGGKPFKTREGGTVKLKSLLDEAVARAREVVTTSVEGDDRRADMDDREIDRIAETVGISAIIYFDLSHNLAKDYTFDLDTMLSLEGNTAPYMLYAYARIRSIGRKAGVDLDDCANDALALEHPMEMALARQIARFPDVLDQIGRDLHPNLLTEYLYELSRVFSRFYDRKLGVRVIDAEPESTRASRLALVGLTARALRLGLWLLGIRTLERM
jgi:arginyl-tRNA synthetase